MALVKAFRTLETYAEKRAALTEHVESLTVAEMHSLRGLMDRRQMQRDVFADLEPKIRHEIVKYLAVADIFRAR